MHDKKQTGRRPNSSVLSAVNKSWLQQLNISRTFIDVGIRILNKTKTQ